MPGSSVITVPGSMRQVERWMQVPDLAACSAISEKSKLRSPDGFAVVHVQAHAVSQSVRHEEGHAPAATASSAVPRIRPSEMRPSARMRYEALWISMYGM